MVIAAQKTHSDLPTFQLIRDWLQHIVDQKGWSGSEIAKRSGLSAATILRIVNQYDPDHLPSIRTLKRIAEGTGYPVPGEIMEAMGATTRSGVGQASRPDSTERRGSVRIPLIHVSSLPSSLHPIGRQSMSVAAPEQLEGDSTAFGFYMPDASLEPFVKAGTLMLATKRRDPVVGDLVLLTSKSGRSWVRIVQNIDENGIGLRSNLIGNEVEKLESFPYDDIENLAIISVMIKH